MKEIAQTFLSECRRRLPIFAFAIFLVWPAFSFLMGTLAAFHMPYHSLTIKQATLISLGGMAVMEPDFLIVGLLGLGVSLTVFSILACCGVTITANHRLFLIVEPVILFGAIILGASLYYPSVLSQPVFTLFRDLPIWMLTLIIAFIVTACSVLLAIPGHRVSVTATLLVFAILAPLPSISRNKMAGNIHTAPPLVLLGIDSTSLCDDLAHLKSWTKQYGGAWYTKAVTPGLFTNSVWSSILLMKPVREHGVFHTFQSRPKVSWTSLIKEAKRQGYYTVSVFPDQLTCWVGSDFRFDLDRSGPIGWRQLATSVVENASILLPLVKPILPRFPFSPVPPNHAGSYTYSIEREFNEIFSQSSPEKPTLVVGHSTYLHVPAYPLYWDLSWEECKRVLKSPAYRVKDRSMDWQDKDQPDDAIPLRQWKLQRFQTVLIESIAKTKFLEKGGRMVLLSDHGARNGISSENFHEERYHNVMLATFNLPRRPTDLPISIIDSGSLLGLVKQEPFDPVVEFAGGEPSEWPPLVNSAQLKWNGRVSLDKNLLAAIFKKLHSHRPWKNVADLKSISEPTLVFSK